jgi:replicative DNA helicase Mcm
MARAENTEIIDSFEEFYRTYYRNEIGELARKYPNDQRSLYISWDDLYRFDQSLAEDVRTQPDQFREYAEEALRLYDLPVDVSLGQAHVRIYDLPETTEIRDIRSHHAGQLVSLRGIIRKATNVRPKIQDAAFECQRCGSLTRVPQTGGDFHPPHECQGCERQGPFRINFDQSEFVDAQKLRVQESPEGLRGGERPQNLDIHIEDDITGEVTAGDTVRVTGVLHLDQQESQGEKSTMFDIYIDGVSIDVEDDRFEDMNITEEDKKEIISLSDEDDIYEQMIASMAPSIYGYDEEKLAIILQLFSGVTKNLPDGSRIRGDMHILLIGDPGTGKSQLLQYVRNIAPRSVYTAGKGSSAAGLTAAAVRDDFSEGQQWSLEAGALVLADQGVAAVDELDKMRCVTGDTLVETVDEGTVPIQELTHSAAKQENGKIEQLENGRTIRTDDEMDVWTMTDDAHIVPRSIKAIHEYDAPDRLHEVTLESGETLTTTTDHPFFVIENGERTEKPAVDLAANHRVCVPDDGAVTDGGANTHELRDVSYRTVEHTRIIDTTHESVYDLTVEGTHNFIANGMVVHNSEDRSAMHEALEQQEISVSKAGINATLKSRCSLLGAANPKYGRFDEYEAIAGQIDLEPALISRFDIIFTVKDKPDPETDKDLAQHIINTNYAGELHTHRTETSTSNVSQEEVDSVTEDVEPSINADLLRKYIAYAKRSCYPMMTEEAKGEIEDFYVDLRSQGTDSDSPVPVTARKLEAFVRLAEASARVRLSDTVEQEDVERILEIVTASLEDIGMDPETGEFDADVVETGTSKSQRDRIRNIKGLISEIEDEYDDGAPIEEVINRAETVDIGQSKAEHEIEKLREQGDVYEPTNGHLRIV